jgi:hypothetical protein
VLAGDAVIDDDDERARIDAKLCELEADLRRREREHHRSGVRLCAWVWGATAVQLGCALLTKAYGNPVTSAFLLACAAFQAWTAITHTQEVFGRREREQGSP